MNKEKGSYQKKKKKSSHFECVTVGRKEGRKPKNTAKHVKNDIEVRVAFFFSLI